MPKRPEENPRKRPRVGAPRSKRRASAREPISVAELPEVSEDDYAEFEAFSRELDQVLEELGS